MIRSMINNQHCVDESQLDTSVFIRASDPIKRVYAPLLVLPPLLQQGRNCQLNGMN